METRGPRCLKGAQAQPWCKGHSLVPFPIPAVLHRLLPLEIHHPGNEHFNDSPQIFHPDGKGNNHPCTDDTQLGDAFSPLQGES